MIKTKEFLPLSSLFQKYMIETANGRRLQKNGKRISNSTISNYKAFLVNLKAFELSEGEQFMVNTNYKHSKRNFDAEKKRYKKFYLKFTDFLYAKGCTDNYVGSLIKQVRSFFIDLNQNKGYNTGNFFKEFYVRKEDIPIVVLSMDQLKFLIDDKEFKSNLPDHLKVSKDIFVLGCTVGLRFSDLIGLRKKNLERVADRYYITTKSIKTNTYTRIKLPDYAIEIIMKYKWVSKTLLPGISLNQFNKNLKAIGEMALWTHEVGKERSRRGVRKEIRSNGKSFRFCDLMSSHMMRRTAITTLLIHGMPEPLVRKISGHAPGSKEFYKYVQYSETFLDNETDRVFSRMLSAVSA